MREFLNIVVGTVIGTIARIAMLKEDYRQYPSFPNGHLIHITTGFVAAALGAVAIPALVEKNYVAVTFLALAIQQFREVRKTERDTLTELEESELVRRGTAYIDGIAKSFEARNYVAMLAALVGSASMQFIETGRFFLDAAMAAVLGGAAILLIGRFTRNSTVGDIAEVEIKPLEFREGDLYVGDIYVMNVGLRKARDLILKEGLGAIINPKGHAAHITFANWGQRQAIAHEVARIMGVKRYIATRRDFETGRIALAVVPQKRDELALKEVISQVPILESIRRKRTVTIGGKP